MSIFKKKQLSNGTTITTNTSDKISINPDTRAFWDPDHIRYNPAPVNWESDSLEEIRHGVGEVDLIAQVEKLSKKVKALEDALADKVLLGSTDDKT